MFSKGGRPATLTRVVVEPVIDRRPYPATILYWSSRCQSCRVATSHPSISHGEMGLGAAVLPCNASGSPLGLTSSGRSADAVFGGGGPRGPLTDLPQRCRRASRLRSVRRSEESEHTSVKYEVEQKFPVADLSDVESRLADLGAGISLP